MSQIIDPGKIDRALYQFVGDRKVKSLDTLRKTKHRKKKGARQQDRREAKRT